MVITYTKTEVSEPGKRDVLKNQREVRAVDVIVLLTNASLRLASTRETVNLALLYRIVVRIVCRALYLTARVQEIQS